MNNSESTIRPANYRLLKSLNKNTVLNLIRTDGPISGAALAKITGMRPATVQNILKNLENKGLVVKVGTGLPTKMGGRPPTLWEICGNYGYVIGIQLEINEIRAVLVNLKSQVISEFQIIYDTFHSLADIEKKIILVIKNILKNTNIDEHCLLGIGIGVSGLVDINQGIILKTSLLCQSSVPVYLERSLRKYYDIPIYIENDANAAALAEKWFGARKDVEHFIFALAIIDKDVFGIGYGLLLKNDIYRGANMFAGETTSYDLTIKKILVDHCHYTEKQLFDGYGYIDVDKLHIHDLVRAIESGNPVVRCFFAYVGKLIAHELSSAINLLDPQMIVIGGDIARAKEHILGPINTVLNNDGLLVAERHVRIVESSLPGNSVSLGAASIILQNILSPGL
ncbi:ROK family transcriptional regulator [candidate division KSB1 bacterium]|nr:ROK family transcriptional regulator [candidate division KSB1 bacterium]RQW00356.1 MAG: ROK family transcriptional regulator [candidate division KSB1 bacterium]